MPRYALLNSPTGKRIDARDITVKQNELCNFYCCTKGCSAKMIPVNAGDAARAYFRSLRKNDHISFDCVKTAIDFEPSKYDEKSFSLDFAFESMLGKNHTIETIERGTTGTLKKKVGGGRKNRIHTLPLMYAMCLSLGKSKSYNGCLIDDILADNENYNRYKNGITGYKIVETSCYYAVNGETSFIMNFPSNFKKEHELLKINFTDKNLFFRYRQKLIDTNHTQPVIVAGEWSLSKK